MSGRRIKFDPEAEPIHFELWHGYPKHQAYTHSSVGESCDVTYVLNEVAMRTFHVHIAVLSTQSFFSFVIGQHGLDAFIEGAEVSESALVQTDRCFSRRVNY